MPATRDHPEAAFSSNPQSFSPTPDQVPAILEHLDSPTASLYNVAQANNTTIDALSAWMMSPEIRARQELINSAAAQRNHDLALRAQRRSIAVITQILDRAQEEESEHAFSNEPKPTLARTRRREQIGKLTRVLLQLKTDAAKTLPSPTPIPTPPPPPTPCPPRLRAKPPIRRRSDSSVPASSVPVAHRSKHAKAPRPQCPAAHRHFPVMHPRLISPAASLTTIALLTSAAFAQPRFQITELPTLGGVGSRGVAVNNSGLVCGESNRLNEGYMVATAWLPPDHHPIYLTGSGGSVATGSSVNESGVIVGYSDLLGNAYRATPPGAAPEIIGEMGMHGGMAACITEHGDLCGGWGNANGNQPFMIRAGVFTALPLLEGGMQGGATAINETGLAVGWSEEGPNGAHQRAAKWENGVVTQLAGGESLNAANAVNDEGWIVGYTSDPTFTPERATLWTDPETPIDLGTLVPTHWQNWAYAINNRRQIVGTSGDHAFLWENGVMQDLELAIPADSNWLLYEANGISDNGLIVGQGLHNGVVRGFLLTPITSHCSADFDGNGDTGTDQDIDAFFTCLAGTCCTSCGSADFNGDGDVGTDADIESFFRVLAGGSC